MDDSTIGRYSVEKVEKPKDTSRAMQLRRKVAAQRKQQQQAEEAAKEKELQLVALWEKTMETRRQKAVEEREERKMQMVVAKKPKKEGATGGMTFLTSLPEMPYASSKAVDAASRQAEPRPPAAVLARASTMRVAATSSSSKTPRGERLCITNGPVDTEHQRPTKPTMPKPERRRERSNVNSQKAKKETDDSYTGPVTTDAIAKRYPGLAGSSEGRAIKDRARAADEEGPSDPSASLMPNKTLVRKAQAQIMNKLGNQLVHYKQQIKVHFKRILDAVEVQYTDRECGRTRNLNRVDMDTKT